MPILFIYLIYYLYKYKLRVGHLEEGGYFLYSLFLFLFIYLVYSCFYFSLMFILINKIKINNF